MTLHGYVAIFRRRWWVVAAATIAAALVMFILTPAKPSDAPPASTYTATATLLAETAPAVGGAGQAPSQTMSLGRLALLITTGEIPRLAAERLGFGGDPALLAREVVVTPDQQGGAVTISATDQDSQIAADQANAFADATVEYFETQGGTSRVTILQEATPLPNKPSGGAVIPPNRGFRTLLGALVGMLLGLALAILVDHLDRRLRTRDEIHQAVGLPVVAEVPKLPRSERQPGSIVVSEAPLSAYADGYRAARAALLHMPSKPIEFDGSAPRRPGRAVGQWGQSEEFGAGAEPLARSTGRVVMITSALASEGKTTTAANIAASFAETGKRVLVVDADLRSPDINQLFDVPQGAGVSDYLIHEEAAPLSSYVRPTNVEGVGIVTAGTQLQHPESLTSRIEPLISAARQLADIVVVDASPILGASDAFDILPLVDTVLLAVRSGRLTEAAAQRVAELLGRFHVPVAGVVVIAAPSDSSDGYGYGYGKGYGYGEKRVKGKRSRAARGAGDAAAVEPVASSASRPAESASDWSPRRAAGD